MKSFTTRVELHHASTWQDYVTLHSEMAREGFSRTIAGNDGVVYDLPTAEYVINADLTIEQVVEKAKRAATKTNKTHAVFTTEALRWMWSGLGRASKAA